MPSDPGAVGPEICCLQLAEQLSWNCPHHKSRMECPDVLIIRTREANSKENNFGLSIKDGGSSFLKIQYCPFCGYHLNSLRRGP